MICSSPNTPVSKDDSRHGAQEVAANLCLGASCELRLINFHRYRVLGLQLGQLLPALIPMDHSGGHCHGHARHLIVTLAMKPS